MEAVICNLRGPMHQATLEVNSSNGAYYCPVCSSEGHAGGQGGLGLGRCALPPQMAARSPVTAIDGTAQGFVLVALRWTKTPLPTTKSKHSMYPASKRRARIRSRFSFKPSSSIMKTSIFVLADDPKSSVEMTCHSAPSTSRLKKCIREYFSR